MSSGSSLSAGGAGPFAEMTMALVSVMVDICSLYNQKTLRVMKKAL